MACDGANQVVLRSDVIVIGCGVRVRGVAELIVARGRPLEVGLNLVGLAGDLWWIGRDLLALGVAARAGDMDVVVAPVGAVHVEVMLRASHRGDVDLSVVFLVEDVERALAVSWLMCDGAAEAEWVELSVLEVISRCVFLD